MTIPVASGRWPFLGHAPSMLSRRVRFTSSLRHYGDIVKIYLGPLKAYFLTSPQLVHQVLVTNGASFEKGIIFDRFRPFMGNGLVMSPEPFHLRQRRLMQPAFHAGQLARYAETMRQATADLITTWQPGGVRQFDADTQRLAVSIVGQTLFATQVGKPAIDEAQRSIPIVLKDGMIRALLPSMFDRLPIVPATRRFDHAVHRLRQTVLEVITSRRADPHDHGDLLSILLNARDADTDERMTDQEIFDEVITLFTAGSETIAVALAWFFHELARNPEIEQRVRAEIAQTLDDRPITFDDVPKLTYTRRVIDEVLRMYPIWILMRRARQDVELGGIHLRAGTEVMFSPYSLHLDSRFHANPDRFDPDRWETNHDAPPKGAFIPFGLGTRQCIGNKFAYTEITIAAATILAGWRLLPVPRQRVGIKVTSAAYPTRMPMTAVPLT